MIVRNYKFILLILEENQKYDIQKLTSDYILKIIITGKTRMLAT